MVVSTGIMGQKYLKLFVNFNNCIPALIGKSMQETFADLDLCKLSILLLREGVNIVQNAGIYPWQLIENTSADDWDRVMAVNLRGTFNATRAALVPMKAQRFGRMLFTSSITGPRVTFPGHGHYSASKAGINGLIRAAALEGAAHGITVNGVEPGNILTEAIELHRGPAYIKNMEDSIPLGRLGSPRDVANAFLFLASDDASYITGTTIIVDGGQLLPEGNDFRLLPP